MNGIPRWTNCKTSTVPRTAFHDEQKYQAWTGYFFKKHFVKNNRTDFDLEHILYMNEIQLWTVFSLNGLCGRINLKMNAFPPFSFLKKRTGFSQVGYMNKLPWWTKILTNIFPRIPTLEVFEKRTYFYVEQFWS